MTRQRMQQAFLIRAKPPRLPKWHRAFASLAAQTVPKNPANAATALLQRPVPLTLRHAGTSAAQTPSSRAAGWDVATFLLLFSALTKGKRASQFASLSFSLTLPGSLNMSQLLGSMVLRNRLHQQVLPILSSSQPETLTCGVPP